MVRSKADVQSDWEAARKCLEDTHPRRKSEGRGGLPSDARNDTERWALDQPASMDGEPFHPALYGNALEVALCLYCTGVGVVDSDNRLIPRLNVHGVRDIQVMLPEEPKPFRRSHFREYAATVHCR